MFYMRTISTPVQSPLARIVCGCHWQEPRYALTTMYCFRTWNPVLFPNGRACLKKKRRIAGQFSMVLRPAQRGKRKNRIGSIAIRTTRGCQATRRAIQPIVTTTARRGLFPQDHSETFCSLRARDGMKAENPETPHNVKWHKERKVRTGIIKMFFFDL